MQLPLHGVNTSLCSAKGQLSLGIPLVARVSDATIEKVPKSNVAAWPGRIYRKIIAPAGETHSTGLDPGHLRGQTTPTAFCIFTILMLTSSHMLAFTELSERCAD